MQNAKSILQFFRSSLSYHLPLRSVFCLFLRRRFRQVLQKVIYDNANLLTVYRSLLECNYMHYLAIRYGSAVGNIKMQFVYSCIELKENIEKKHNSILYDKVFHPVLTLCRNLQS